MFSSTPYTVFKALAGDGDTHTKLPSPWLSLVAGAWQTQPPLLQPEQMRLQRQPWSQLRLLGGKQVRIQKKYEKTSSNLLQEAFLLRHVTEAEKKSTGNQAYWTGSLLSVTISHISIKNEHSAPYCANAGIFPINEALCMH